MKKELILASGSPRRHEILTLAGIPHRVLVPPAGSADESAVEETPDDPGTYVRRLAQMKNRAALCAFGGREEFRSAAFLTADTVVWLPGRGGSPGEILGKPKDKEDAARMLRDLSGREHYVLTGVMISDPETGRETVFSEETEVRFRELREDEIQKYAASGDPFDKAGAYGYQSGACIFVESIKGDYFNVVGLPVCRVSVELYKLFADERPQ